MKKVLSLYLLLIVPIIIYSQDDDRHNIYTNVNTLEIWVNRESTFSNEKTVTYKGFGFELNSLHGIYIFKVFALSAGVGISFNINEDYKGLPILADLKWYLYPYGENSPYVLLNVGENLKLKGFERGHTAKLGLGYSFDSDSSFQYIIEAFLKSYEWVLDSKTGYNYQVSSIGISLGLKFL